MHRRSRSFGRSALVLLLSLALWGSAWAGPASRARPSVRRLRDMSSLRSAASRHPYTGRIVRRVQSDRLRTIDSVGGVSPERLAERAGWVPLGADPELRKVTVATVERKIRQRAGALRRLIKARPAEATWDVIFIGAGVHTAIAANTLANLETDQPIHMLTIEGSSDIGGTFREVGTTVSRNSANRASRKGARARRGFGDKNPSEGPWGDPDLSGQEWPELGILADTATVNLFASGSDILLGSRVKSVESRDRTANSAGWPARYRVTMSDGAVVYANAVARATGLGEATLRGVDDATRRLVQSEREKIDLSKPDEVPGVLYYKDALRLANLSRTGRDPYRGPALAEEPRSRRVEAVRRLGGGAADVTILANGQQIPLDQLKDIRSRNAEVIRVAPREGDTINVASPLVVYSGGREVARIDARDPVIQDAGREVRPTIAVIGGRDSGRTFLEYLYGQGPASAYNGGGKIDSAQRGEIGDVEWFVGENGPADCGEFLQTTRSRYLRLAGKVRDVGDGSAPRAVLRKSRVTSVRKLDNGRYQLTDSRGQTRVVDRVIFATGFENNETEDGQIEPIRGRVSGLKGDRTYAKRVQGEDIFRFGPAAGNDVVDRDERYSTDENAGSIYAFAPRDRAFARKVLADVERAGTHADTASIDRTTRIKLAEGDSRAVIKREASARALETPLSDLVIRSEMLDVLAAIQGAPSRGELSFRVVFDQKAKKLAVEGLNHQGAEQVAELIGQSPLLCDQLEAATENGGAVEFKAPLSNGRVIRTQLKMSM